MWRAGTKVFCELLKVGLGGVRVDETVPTLRHSLAKCSTFKNLKCQALMWAALFDIQWGGRNIVSVQSQQFTEDIHVSTCSLE